MIADKIRNINQELPSGTILVAVSKFHPSSAIQEAYDAGQRVFGESRPQELFQKVKELPDDIQWHFIGHLQTNKFKMVLPYVSMIESIDSLHLLEAVSRWGADNGRQLDVLLELHLGAEQTKQGFSESEIRQVMDGSEDYPGVRICGLMGMATNTDDEDVIRSDFERIGLLFNSLRKEYDCEETFRELSIGMSSDYRIALDYGATIVRIGTTIFGNRQY